MQQFESTPGSFRVCCRVCGSTALGKAAYLTTVDIPAGLLDASPDTGEISQFLYKGLLHVPGVFAGGRGVIFVPTAINGSNSGVLTAVELAGKQHPRRANGLRMRSLALSDEPRG